MREEDDVADRGSVGQEHYQTVNAYALAGGRRHAIFQSPDEILIQYRENFVIITPFVDLFLETLFLIGMSLLWRFYFLKKTFTV